MPRKPMPGQSIGDNLDGFADQLDRKPWVIVTALAISYLLFLYIPVKYGVLWYDELLTYYLSQAPTLHRFVEEMRAAFDANPPLLYGLVHSLYSLFGISEVATRIPTAIAFFLGSMGIFVFLRRRIGSIWASAAIALFWYGPFFRYATEARPYGLLLAFFAMTLVSWDSLSNYPAPHGRALAGIAIGNLGMMLSHLLAPLSIMPFCVAELFRNWRDRKIDWSVWAAMLLPLGCVAAYLPFIQRLGRIYPEVFKASGYKIIQFYSDVIVGTLPASAIALGVALVLAGWRSPETESKPSLTSRDWPLLAACLLPPILLNLVMMRSGGPFWDRYGITTGAMLYVLAVLFVAQQSGLNRLAALAAALILVTLHVGRDVRVLLTHPAENGDQQLNQVSTELPFVTTSANTFLSMDHHEPAGMVGRLYYLTDNESSMRYAHTNLFEEMPQLKEYFPLRGNIQPYPDFASQHRRFLVLGTINRDEDWLLRKLISEGATVTKLGDFNVPYQDTTLYEVRL